MSNLGTVVNVIVALLGFGLLTWLVMGFYAIRRRSRWLFVAAGGYLLSASCFLFVVGTSPVERKVPNALEMIMAISQFVTWSVGTMHVVLLNRSIMGRIRGKGSSAGAWQSEEQRVRREQARYLLYHYPQAREELRIGRPDLPRSFDDGGLVDINVVPEPVIARLPGLVGGQAAQRLVMDRWMCGPFASMEDLAARGLLPPEVSDGLREILVFLPPPGPGPESGGSSAGPEPTGDTTSASTVVGSDQAGRKAG